MRPIYMLFAGVNGAGKSTYYRSNLWQGIDLDMPEKMARVNPDEILLKMGGDPLNRRDQFKAGKVALARIDEFFESGRSFNQETTLCGRLTFKNIERARGLGYNIIIYFIGVDSPETALTRIDHRVDVGGHLIDEGDVRRRFDKAKSNFIRAAHQCDQAVALDNTREFKTLAKWYHGVLAWWGNPVEYGPWLVEAIQGGEHE